MQWMPRFFCHERVSSVYLKRNELSWHFENLHPSSSRKVLHFCKALEPNELGASKFIMEWHSGTMQYSFRTKNIFRKVKELIS